jgi:cytosine/adenosine deaminase-related metal-dependent hydrolase
MRYLTANYIFSAHTGFIPNGILVLDDDGKVLDLIDPAKTDTLPSAEKFDGIICPGFINAHCHLELSFLRDKIARHTGFVGFAKELMTIRNNFPHEEIEKSIELAEEEMYANGIVGVGDISNGTDSYLQKEKNKIRYHTFIELLSLNPKMAEKAAEVGMFLKTNCPQTASLAPHAPYSVSNELLELIGNSSHRENFPLTMHNQESIAESEFFTRGTGPVRELYDFLGVDLYFFKPTGVNSLRSKLKQLPQDRNLVLVHNTFTSEDDIRWAEFYSKQLYWCFCPNANLYIENKLPDFKTFMNMNCKIVVGTDSLASNAQLSVLSELKTIAQNVPEISLANLLTWSTKNGADALGFSELGTFEKNKKPGVVLLSQMANEKLFAGTSVKRIV